MFFKPGIINLNQIEANIKTVVTLKCFDSSLNKRLKLEIEINSETANRDDSVVKLANYKRIKIL